MRVLVFGDSITQGYWAVEHGWVDRLRRYFDAKQFKDLEKNDEPTVFNLGISADTSEDVMRRIDSELAVRTRTHHTTKPAVIVQIGVNDSSIDHGKRQVEIDEYKNNLREIINQLKGKTSTTIFIGSSACDEKRTMPVFWGDYICDNESIKRYEDAMQEVAEDNSIPFVGIFDAFKRSLDSGADLLPDGLHPNDEGHELIFNTLISQVEELLQ